jgi:hypothetical protein
MASSLSPATIRPQLAAAPPSLRDCTTQVADNTQPIPTGADITNTERCWRGEGFEGDIDIYMVCALATCCGILENWIDWEEPRNSWGGKKNRYIKNKK